MAKPTISFVKLSNIHHEFLSKGLPNGETFGVWFSEWLGLEGYERDISLEIIQNDDQAWDYIVKNYIGVNYA